jgi:hypothetical protein
MLLHKAQSEFLEHLEGEYRREYLVDVAQAFLLEKPTQIDIDYVYGGQFLQLSQHDLFVHPIVLVVEFVDVVRWHHHGWLGLSDVDINRFWLDCGVPCHLLLLQVPERVAVQHTLNGLKSSTESALQSA